MGGTLHEVPTWTSQQIGSIGRRLWGVLNRLGGKMIGSQITDVVFDLLEFICCLKNARLACAAQSGLSWMFQSEYYSGGASLFLAVLSATMWSSIHVGESEREQQYTRLKRY